jgi:hypothetical protein
MPTGEFEAATLSPVGSAGTLLGGDLDGDGRGDVISLQPLDAIGETRLRFHYFDERGALVDTRSFPKLMFSPFVSDLSGDGRADVVFSNLQVGMLLGRADRSWLPETFSSYRVPGASVRLLSVSDQLTQDSLSLVVVTTLQNGPGFYVPNASSGTLRWLGRVDGVPDKLLGDPVSGKVIESAPCAQLVFALRGESEFSMIESCMRATSGELVWRNELKKTQIALEPAPDAPLGRAPAIEAAPQLVDMNHDGHLDVLLSTAIGLYVAEGDGQVLRAAKHYSITLSNPGAAPPPFSMPLAAADFTADGAIDFVFPRYLLLSARTPASTSVHYVPINSGSNWSAAVIADFNHNGSLDIMAASNDRLDIDFLNGTDSGFVVASRVPTDGPVEQLAVGDFDGDSINDLAFIQKGDSAQRDSLEIAYGTLLGQPLAPAAVASVSHVEQLNVGFEPGHANISIASTETIDGRATGLATLLGGSPDRIPFSPYALVDFSPQSSSLVESPALALCAGGFSAPRARDVLILTRVPLRTDLSNQPSIECKPSERDFQFWLLPGLATSSSRQIPLEGMLDPRLHPAESCESRIASINVTSAVADLDRDGRDEALWAMPADANHCGIEIVGVSLTGSPKALMREPIMLDEPCTRAELLPVDADADGWADIAVLTGGPGEPARKLLILWNDGKGGFASSQRALLNRNQDSPESFTLLRATPGRPLSFGYVTDQNVVLVSASETPRRFSEPRSMADVRHGTGITAGDLNGDGVVDLAVAASGSLNVFKARLEIR